MDKKHLVVSFIVILASFAAAFYFYPLMPERIASHWGLKGTVDGYMTKFWGLFLLPVVSLVVLFLFILIPKLDPLKENIAKFKNFYGNFIVLTIIFLSYINFLVIFWNLGIYFNIIQALSPGMAVLFFYTGILLEKVKRNWFIGIRTPWTLSSEEVWDKTNKLGAKFFKVAGAAALFGVIFPDYFLYIIFVPLLFMVFFTVIYSYFEYKKHE